MCSLINLLPPKHQAWEAQSYTSVNLWERLEKRKVSLKEKHIGKGHFLLWGSQLFFIYQLLALSLAVLC